VLKFLCPMAKAMHVNRIVVLVTNHTPKLVHLDRVVASPTHHLERARRRGADLEERLRQLAGEGQAWLGVARSHEAVAAGLRATLDKVLQQPAVAAAGGGECGVAEDAQSCCFVASPSGLVAGDAVSTGSSPSCKACGGGEGARGWGVADPRHHGRAQRGGAGAGAGRQLLRRGLRRAAVRCGRPLRDGSGGSLQMALNSCRD
jgi:hypothetical protein